MSLEDRLMADLKDATRNRQGVRMWAIRMARAAIANEAIESRRPLDDGEVATVLMRLVKQRRESIEAFTLGNRPELAAKEQQELDILLSYLPPQMSRDEIAEAAKGAIQEVGASSPNDFGKVMSRLAPALKGRAEGKAIGEVVRELLSQ